MATCSHVAGLTEVRSPFIQQFVVVATMGGMANQAVLRNRGMLIHEGPTFFGVTLVAELVDGISLQTLGVERSMRIMAIATGDLAFLDGVV